MNVDISQLLQDWAFDPEQVSARWITGLDGLQKIQLRLDLGLFQMEVEGRPDGLRPRGYPSMVDYFKTAEKKSRDIGEELALTEEDCAFLQQEAVQYYYRYLAFFALRFFEGVIRDTQHSLNLLELVDRYAVDDDSAWQLLQFYPYVRMMHARAKAEVAAADKDFDSAITVLEEGLEDIRMFWSDAPMEPDEEDVYEEYYPSQEEEFLQGLLRHFQKKRPKSQKDQLSEALQKAIETEDYERAAQLRDRLNALVPAPGKV